MLPCKIPVCLSSLVCPALLFHILLMGLHPMHPPPRRKNDPAQYRHMMSPHARHLGVGYNQAGSYWDIVYAGSAAEPCN